MEMKDGIIEAAFDGNDFVVVAKTFDDDMSLPEAFKKRLSEICDKNFCFVAKAGCFFYAVRFYVGNWKKEESYKIIGEIISVLKSMFGVECVSSGDARYYV